MGQKGKRKTLAAQRQREEEEEKARDKPTRALFHAQTASRLMSPKPSSIAAILAPRSRPSSSSLGTTSISATYTNVPAASADTAAPTPPDLSADA